jgi:lysyl endopeptidase
LREVFSGRLKNIYHLIIFDKLQLIMKMSLRLLLTACAISLLVACGNNGNNTSTVDSEKSAATSNCQGSPLGTAPDTQILVVDAYRSPASTAAQESPIKPRDLSVAPTAASVSLGAPLASLSASMQKSNESAASATSSEVGKPLKIGFGRDVPQTSTAAATQQVLKWQTTASGGQVAAINFNSTGAKGIRIGLLVTQLPETAKLRFYAAGAATAFEVKGADVLKVLATNLAAGDKSDAGRTYWGPSIDAANATLEIELPNGTSTNTVNVAMPQVMHMTMSANDIGELPAISAMSSGTDGVKIDPICSVDVTCAQTLPAASHAVAAMSFIFADGNGGLYGGVCSGTLLNDSTNSGTPYMLTANHCISTQTVASTLTTKFEYRSKVCNNPVNYTYFDTTPVGAKLLHTARKYDGTLLQLNGKPSSPNPLYAGWDATTAPAIGLDTTGVHHPLGIEQRMTRSKVSRYFTRDPNPTSFGLFDANVTTADILGVDSIYGFVQAGSSGSGLFSGTDNNPKLIGILSGASNNGLCTTADPTKSMPQLTSYGRFDVAFNAGMKAFLSPPVVPPVVPPITPPVVPPVVPPVTPPVTPPVAPITSPSRLPVYRFYIPQSGMYFYTIYTSERDSILATMTSKFTYEGVAFYAVASPTAGFDAIYRFRNNLNGSYLFTISDVEKASILQNYPQYVLEGTAWYAEKGTAGGGSPLYRFRTNNGSHIYTAYESEKASILANYPSFVLEGPAYYVKLAP